MARINVTEDEMLSAMVNHLQDELSLNDSRCFETDQPSTAINIPVGGDYALTVSPGPSTFDEELQIGGGDDQLMENATFYVTIHTRIKLDHPSKSTLLIHDVRRGLLPLKKKVLKALVNADPTIDTDTFLRQTVTAMGSDAPKYDEQEMTGWQTIQFSAPFDWDLG